ncbi:uncharacterized protein PHALS_03322 [Plasmopara halstedii]|uniref:Uncharacterized protein n=1 Tax=Plasmopara halstedii TaxID=4781 RepID=A0A0N7L3S0_PLAHL|nr:uncharacterized protein PHALS_03322 [Plasmopara halstedii]CEG36651.1 hypothetical protein PHALS_03322 [Plasmopara halstedii]|eukprot:XP_024573020.1 hypothetical protein PHALS_03322 [Plasmopara halstedii]
MVLDCELRCLLDQARSPEMEISSIRPTVQELFERLATISQQNCSPFVESAADINLPELLVLTGELAIHQKDFHTAEKCIEWFFSECHIKNQFYCRALFIRAHCESHEAQGDTGVMKLKKVLNAIHFILAVIPIATSTQKRPKYDFLVYNASVTYWQIARQLMKPSTFQFLVSSLTIVVNALKLTAESDVSWLLQLQLALVYAQVDANVLTNAAKTINDIVDTQITPRLTNPTTSDVTIRTLYEEALRVQIHVGSLKDSECMKIVPNVKRLIRSTDKKMTLLVKLQCLKSNIVSGSLEAAYVEIIQEVTGFTTLNAETSLNEVKAFVSSLEPRALEVIDTEVLVETAIHAVFSNMVPLAAVCDVVLQHKGKKLPPKTRVLGQALHAILQANLPPPHPVNKVSLRQQKEWLFANRVEAIKTFERILVASRRRQDPHLIESVCIYAWNLSLPLLQPHICKLLARVLNLVSSLLKKIDSLLLEFRARLYLETAKLEIASHSLLNANQNIFNALALDYGTIVRPRDVTIMTVDLLAAHDDWIIRPVDTHLRMMKQQLDLKLGADSSSQEIEVLAMFEQARGSKDTQQQQKVLMRCIDMMKRISGASELSSGIACVRLWSKIVSFAWDTMHDSALAQKTIDMVLSTYFPTGEADKILNADGKCLLLSEFDMRLQLVEILAMRLKDEAIHTGNARRQARMSVEQTGESLGESVDAKVLISKETYLLGLHRPINNEILSSIDAGVGGTAVDEKAKIQQIYAVKVLILENIMKALNMATKVGWAFMLENVSICLWNHHYHVFQMLKEVTQASSGNMDAIDPQWILPECVSAFEAVYAALEAAAASVDINILANVALGLSRLYETIDRFDKSQTIADIILKRNYENKIGEKRMSVLQLKMFAELKVRGQIAQNAKIITPPDEITEPITIVVYLVAMEGTLRQMSLSVAQQPPQLLEKAQAFYQSAITSWHAYASVMFASFMSNDAERLIEEEQQLMELYAEIWTRIGYGAFRFEHLKYAIECAEQALLVLKASEGKKSKKTIRLLVLESTWKWLALAELLIGRTTLALAHEKPIAHKLLNPIFTHLVRACEYGLRSNDISLIIRACEVIWNAIILVMNDDLSNELVKDIDRVVNSLRTTLGYFDQVVASSQANTSFYGEMVLLTLAICDKARKWRDQNEICEAVLKTFGSISSRPSLSFPVINELKRSLATSVARIGRSSCTLRLRTDSKSSYLSNRLLNQAEIFKKIAVTWKNPPAQFKALSQTYIEFEGQTEQQALVLLDLAELLFTNQHAVKDTDSSLEFASSMLLQCQKEMLETETMQENSNQLSISNQENPNAAYSPLWFAEKQFRISMMRAIISVNCTKRSEHMRLALNEVESAWGYIIDTTNDNDFRAAYERDNLAQENRISFDEWRLHKLPKYIKPTTRRDWIDFFTSFDENASNRFYMPWNIVQVSKLVHITQPVLTLTYLERLLVMLRKDGLQYSSMIPPLCLYIMVFHTYVPQRSVSAHIWMELIQFSIMEHLNLSNYLIPLQNALDMLQGHHDSLIIDLQSAQQFIEKSGDDIGLRRRCILRSSLVDPLLKTFQSIKLLLRFGFHHQAKSLFEILRFSTQYCSDVPNLLNCKYKYLSSLFLEIEGRNEQALAQVESSLKTSQLEMSCFLKWTLRYCKLNPDLDKALSALLDAEKRAIEALTTPNQTQTYRDEVTYDEFDAAFVQLLARLKFRQATILLKKAAASQGSTVLAYVKESQQAMEKSIEILKHVDAHYQRSQHLMKYVMKLQSLRQTYDGVDLSLTDLDVTFMLQEILTLQEKCYETQSDLNDPHSDKYQNQEGLVSPLRRKIALTKLRIAQNFLAPELSSAAIKQIEMTWFRYNNENERDVVKKWLKETEVVAKSKRLVDLPRAMTFITSAIAMLSDNHILEKQYAIAQVLKLQCQRLAFFRGDNRQKLNALYTHLWTRYTSSDACDATWVCCHGTQAENAIIASRNTAEKQDENQRLTEDERGDEETQMEEQLTAYAAELRKYQLIAFDKQSTELLRLCSNELIQVLGCCHPFDCAKNVLVHQSVEVIEAAGSLYTKCVANTNVQHLHLQRMKKLQKTHTSAETHSLPFQLSQLYLGEHSDAYKRMSAGTHVDAIVTALPHSVRLLCLHFSPDRCYVYAAFLGSTESCVAISRMEFTDTHVSLYESLQSRIQAWRKKCAKETLAYAEAHGQNETFEFMPTTEMVMSNNDNTKGNQGEDVLEAEFAAIISDTIGLLNPLWEHSAMKMELADNLAGNTLILLLDQAFACLPMEALPVFDPADAIARDFSIQILHQRLLASKKQSLRPDEIRVIVDPYKEDSGTPTGKTITSVVKLVADGWKDAVGHGQIPSMSDWQQTLVARLGGGLLYVGPNRVLGSWLPLQYVAGMNVAHTCQVLLLLDQAENVKSARRQSKIDILKPTWEKEIETDPYARALLLTLCGVNTLSINQWATTFDGNRRLASGLLQFISEKHSIGKALKMFGSFPIASFASTSANSELASDSSADGRCETTNDQVRLKNRFRYNHVVYGLGFCNLTGSE